MPGLALGIFLAGYSFFYYGLTQVQGGNWGLLDLTLPRRWANAKNTPRDTPAGTTAKADSGLPAGTPIDANTASVLNAIVQPDVQAPGSVHGTGVITGPDGKLYQLAPDGSLVPIPTAPTTGFAGIGGST